MARDKKTMIGFDPLAWLDNDGEEKVTVDQDNDAVRNKSKKSKENSIKKEESQVVAKQADKNKESKPKAAAKNKVKMIDVLGSKLDEVALLKGYEISTSKLDEIIQSFYTDLFEQYPDVQDLFINVDDQGAKLKSAVMLLIENIHNQDALKIALNDLGVRHQEYGALPDHFPVVAKLLMANFKRTLGRQWTKAVNTAWLTLLDIAAKEMCAAYVDAKDGVEKPEDEVQKNDALPTDTNDTDDNAMIQSDQAVLQLHSVQDIGKSQALKNDMLALINDNDEINIEASEVERIDGSALQLLCALFQYSSDHNLVIHWIKPSNAVIDSATTLGLKTILELS